MKCILCLGLLIFLWLTSIPVTLAYPLPFSFVNTTCDQLFSLAKNPPKLEDIFPHIDLEVDVLDLTQIDETEQTATLDLLIQLRWQDSRLNRQMKAQTENYCLGKAKEIWHPHLGILNSKSMQNKLEELVYVSPDGTIIYSQFLRGKVDGKFNFKKFPFDDQKIPIKIILFDNNLIDLIDFKNDKEINKQYSSIINWSLKSIEKKISIVTLGSSVLKLKCFEYYLNVERQIIFPIWKIIFPVSLITFMPYLVFWMRSTLIVPQITLSVVTIISIIAFQSNLASEIPHISYLTGADKFVIGSMLMILFALVQTVISLNLSESGQDKLATSLDFWMRFLYPIFFIILIFYSFFF